MRELLAELDRDVWQAFRRAYAARDADAFLALHTPDLIRAGGPARQVQGLADYAAETTGWIAELTGRGDGIDIEFRFTERLAAGDLASEQGVYRISVSPAGAADTVFHGRFHTFARRTDGRWRIAVDYDANDGSVDAATFTAATPPAG